VSENSVKIASVSTTTFVAACHGAELDTSRHSHQQPEAPLASRINTRFTSRLNAVDGRKDRHGVWLREKIQACSQVAVVCEVEKRCLPDRQAASISKKRPQ